MELGKEIFEKEISDVDSRLTRENIPAPARPIRATIALFQSHNASGPIAHPRNKDLNFPVTAGNLSDHVSAWYKKIMVIKLKSTQVLANSR